KLAMFRDKLDLPFKTGLFLSALINISKEDDYTIHVANYPQAPNRIGHRNCKNITVHGDIGNDAGDHMEYGILRINGNVGDRLGSNMKYGMIELNGNADVDAGYHMEYGRIVINGNAGKDIGARMHDGIIILNGDTTIVGTSMNGGVLRINGKYEEVASNAHYGTIYHKRRRVFHKIRKSEPEPIPSYIIEPRVERYAEMFEEAEFRSKGKIIWSGSK
ncbi:MAG: hypothetical protein PHF60_04975, partial [Candidatus ainarchaeum sp.]|nr:hypothetical protein [Candidatus ainarchaeum sp.]